MAVPTVITFAGLLIFVSCQPLIRRKVRMNSVYGIRIPAAFESEEQWYAVNEYGARKLAMWSWLIIAAGVTGFFIPAQHFVTYAWTTAPVTLLSVSIPVLQIIVWARKRN